jgi:hypothetical protein
VAAPNGPTFAPAELMTVHTHPLRATQARAEQRRKPGNLSPLHPVDPCTANEVKSSQSWVAKVSCIDMQPPTQTSSTNRDIPRLCPCQTKRYRRGPCSLPQSVKPRLKSGTIDTSNPVWRGHSGAALGRIGLTAGVAWARWTSRW